MIRGIETQVIKGLLSNYYNEIVFVFYIALVIILAIVSAFDIYKGKLNEGRFLLCITIIITIAGVIGIL